MRWTQTLISTLRDAPQDAEITSHKLMIRAGLLRKLGGGLYTFMPLGLRALHKVEQIVREEMDRAGALEILMPALQPAELWQQSGRLETMGPGMFKLKDRQERLMTLGPTHEEVVTDLLAREVSSYRQLPCTVYQIQTKFRDEIRPRFGLMRAKEFIMKDAYSFDVSLEAADASYQAMYDAYTRIFKRCGLTAHPVEADTGDIGGKWSHEFMVVADAGEDAILECAACGYAANQERAERHVCTCAPAADTPPMTDVATPDARTIQEVSAFLKRPAADFIKTLIYVADTKPVAVLVPGDRDVNEQKLKRFIGCKSLALADDDTILKATGAPVGFAGPAGLAIPIYADASLRGATDRVAGANKADTHVIHLSLERDAKVTDFTDLVAVVTGDLCPRCQQTLNTKRGIEVGHVFKLGTQYTDAFNAKFLNEKGEPLTMIMGCYGIGVTRTLQAVVEQHNDADGIIWPAAIAPYQVGILLLDPKDETVAAHAQKLSDKLTALGIDNLIDDREERPGIKFKDADLVGFPLRAVVGAKSLAQGGIELKLRSEKTFTLAPVDMAAEQIREKLSRHKN